MSEVKQGLMYSETHEWVQDIGNGEVTVGITAHAQELLGDVVYVELPKLTRTLKNGDSMGVVESVKAASDIYAPAFGEVIAVNTDLESEPNLINTDPYGKGWIVKLKLSGALPSTLLDAAGYQKAVGG